MSKGGNWVPIDKGAIKTLGNIGRPYSIVEALFSHTIDVDCGRPWTINGYAKLWDWSRGKVRRFINSLRTQSGHIADRKGTQSGHPVHLIDGSLWGEANTKRTQSEHIADRKRDTTIDPNPKPNPKEEKDKPFRAIDFLLSLGVEKQIASDFLAVRKTKKAANTKTAFVAIQREIGKSKISANDVLKKCCVKGWAGFKNSWLKEDKGDSKWQ